ncbi:MAG: O-antigen ligase family protein [Muribaculaceae bacterium]|nr:O-antigen ligase family protein [Muribaculaceae bacterium]
MMQNLTKYLNFETVALFVLCAVAVFARSSSMTDTNLIPKQLYSWFALSAVIILFSAKTLLGKRLNIDFYAWSIIIMSICSLEAIYAIFQWGVNHYLHLNSVYVTGHFDNPAGLMACLCVSLPFALYVYSRTMQHKPLVLGAIVLIYLGIIVSQSRTGIVIGAFVMACYFMRQKRLSLRRICIIAIAMAVVMIVVSYFVNQDSANGRLLIWRCCWDMTKDEPITGYGLGGFRRLYMDYQAAYLQANPDCPFTMLAANVNFPFNEYINLYLCFGILGYICLGLIVALLIVCYRIYPTSAARYAFLSLAIIAFISIFSYPFTYPITWVICLVSILIIVYNNFLNIKRSRTVIASIVFIIIGIVGLCYSYNDIKGEIKWADAYQCNDLVKYKDVSKDLRNNPYFLYSYAITLLEKGEIDESLGVALQCDKLLSNYDLELILGDIYTEKGEYNQAEFHYQKALQMCPCRFMPLNALYDMYIKSGDGNKAHKMAQLVIDKPIKVKSRTVSAIKYKMQRVMQPDKENNEAINTQN